MPRKTRMYLSGVPAHVVQRGNNRQACFYCEEDYHYYLEVLAEGLARYKAQLHAYCLMTNHVHWLVTPEYEDSISRVVQHVGRQYVKYVNKNYRRTGTLWEGRHKGSLIDAERYLLACYRYIELNPVAAKMVSQPGDYKWSSYRHNANGINSTLLTPHPVYLRLHAESEKRYQVYRELFSTPLSTEDKNVVVAGIRSNFPTGGLRFKKQIEAALGRRVGSGKRGRPRCGQ